VKVLIRGGTLVRCDAAGTVGPGDVLVDGARIAAVGRAPARLLEGPLRVIDAGGCAVVPGLIQAHVHLCQALFRGMADDLPLLAWLKEKIWPFEAAHDEASLAASAELGLLEMMLAGTTTILDMGTVHHYDAVFDACARAGIRAFGGKTMMDAGKGVPKGLRETTKQSLAEADRLRASWAGKCEGRLGYAYAPRFILSCTEALFRGTVERAQPTPGAKRTTRDRALLHTHVAEHPDERGAVRAALGDDDLMVLRKWGFKGEHTILAHGVQLTDPEIDAIAADRTRIVHCPSANLKLGSGIARVHELARRGVVVGIGADGAPCNNNLDPWVELRHAALLAKVRTGVTTLPAKQTFYLATIDGARALGIDGVVGSLEVGKRADIVVVRLDGPHVEPGGDAYSRLVYGCTSRDVSYVLVDGQIVVEKGEHRRLDRDRILANARAQAKKLTSRARA
jgi:cytosine/adenosine deaminase-related metal-dependent hydrolase